MNFIPNSPLKQKMLDEISISSINDLFTDIPQSIRINHLNLPDGISQIETERQMKKLAKKNRDCSQFLCFTGGGIKPHYIPAVVKSIISRGEFFTSYTPYQSEASQGFLKAMFEYQSMIASITRMDVANCSLYDYSTALGEAALMATRITKKKKFLIPSHISFEKKSVLINYGKGANLIIKEFGFDNKTGCIDLQSLEKKIDNQCSAIYLEIPNVFGILEKDIDYIKALANKHNILLIIGIDPLVLGIVQSPGDLGADIVIGEGRNLGNPMDFGGSSLGLFSCKKTYLRQIPGRLIGLTYDTHGNEAFCMTLQTREQHIRRGKATSNICTNEGLCALAAVVYLSWLGANGLQKHAKENFDKAQYLKKQITRINGFSEVFNGVCFNEFVIHSNLDTKAINQQLLKHEIHGGFLLESWFPSLKNTFLFGVTEMHTTEDMDKFIKILTEVTNV
ncbi:MAG: aminomethyl-transferring glycine dehydrogenase subunit GcvPA [Promethearchaeota archaeon]|jgi:glycine dehydrogenase subunit 1